MKPNVKKAIVLRYFWGASALFFVAFVLIPRPAHAGFFSSLMRLFSSSDTEAAAETSVAALSAPLLGSKNASVPSIAGPADEEGEPPLPTTQDNALISSKNPLGTLARPGHDQIVLYTVEQGDTPGSIAERFDISLNTLLWANNIKKASAIRVGDQLVILPVTGVQYEIKKGDTPETIAKKFKADAGDIVSFNGLGVGEPLEPGSTIIIPDGELTPSPAGPSARPGTRLGVLPEFSGYYMRPITGGRNPRATRTNPHGIHGYNGVDLANSCGNPVYASADGVVIIARFEGWNGGYGRYIVMNHSNGTQTLYGHLSLILASVGQRVSQGSQIAAIGSTGNSTGCHVHFEIRGARNPF